MRCTHFPASHSSEDADLVSFFHRFRGKFRGRTRAVHDGNVGSACGNFCFASNLYWTVCVYGSILVFLAQDGEAIGLKGVARSGLAMDEENGIEYRIRIKDNSTASNLNAPSNFRQSRPQRYKPLGLLEYFH